MFLVCKLDSASAVCPYMVRPSIDRDDPQIVVGGSRRILVVIRGVANLLPVGREGIVILPAEREHGRVVVAGREIARREHQSRRSCRVVRTEMAAANSEITKMWLRLPSLYAFQWR